MSYRKLSFNRGVKGFGLHGTKTAFRSFRKRLDALQGRHVPYKTAYILWFAQGEIA